MRLIDADKLIKAIEDFFENICVYDVEPSEAEHDFESIVDEMETVNNWIPTSERNPNKTDFYLVTEEGYACGETFRLLNVKLYIKETEKWDGKPSKIIAWMPLGVKEYEG